MRKVTHHRQAKKRSGVAAVEFAVCLPVLVLLVFGSIEASSFIFLKQGLAVAAYETTREAVRPGSNSGEASARGQNILSSRGINDASISIPAGEVGDIPRGQEVIVEVSAPTATNSPLLGRFLTNRVLTSRVVMLKE